MNSDHHLDTHATKILGVKAHSSHTNKTLTPLWRKTPSSLPPCVQEVVLNLPLKKKKKLDKSRMQTVRFGAAPVRVFVSSLTANSSGTEPDGTLDLFESAPTSPTQTHSSEQQIQSKARAETTCKRQRKEGDAGGGGKGETTGGC